MKAYLDNNATTRPTDAVIDAMREALGELWANPSSVHRFGQRARQRVELAREQTADLLGCNPREIVFTSGATESNNLGLLGIVEARGPRRTIISTAIEHSAIREPCNRFEKLGHNVIRIPVDINGLINVEALKARLDEHGDDVAVVSIHWINNETGTIQPIERIGDLCRAHKTPLFTDATQVVGKVPFNLKDLPIDALSFSGHKFHGPKGVGGLFVRTRTGLTPQILGGPHEHERRGGTENVPGIIGLGVACQEAKASFAANHIEHGAAQRDRLETAIIDRVPGAVVNCAAAPRLWNTTNIGFPPLESEAILLLLSEQGICAAAGAACSSGSLEPSPVLLAMGIPRPIAHGSIRLSLSRYTTDAEIDYAIDVVPRAIAKLRASMPAA